MTIPPKPKRRFLRFTLRSLLLLMLIVCLALGWKVEKARKQREAVNWVQECGEHVFYDYELDDARKRVPNPQPPGPKWLRELLGIDFFDDVVAVAFDQVSDVTPLAGLTSLESLMLGGTQVSDVLPLAGLTSLKLLYLSDAHVTDITPLAGLTSLEQLYLNDTQVSDVTPLAGLTSLEQLALTGTQVKDVTPLAGLKNLKRLHLNGTQVSDVTPLARLTSLEALTLSGTQVSEVTPLAGLTKLKWLDLNDTQVSENAVENLKRALPQCVIESGHTTQ